MLLYVLRCHLIAKPMLSCYIFYDIIWSRDELERLGWLVANHRRLCARDTRQGSDAVTCRWPPF